jgi:tetratricopeptide (TPR) repeat protein
VRRKILAGTRLRSSSPRFALALVMIALGCTSAEERAAHHIERGQHYLEQADTRAALLEFQSALKLKPDDAALYERIADILFELSSLPEEALSYYQAAHRLDPTRLKAAMREARLVVFSDPRRARQLVNHGLSVGADQSEVQRALSQVALVEGNLHLALAAAHRGIQIDPSAPGGWAQLGVVHLARISARQRQKLPVGDEPFESALKAFLKVEELLGGKSPRARLEQARVYGFWGRHRQARRTFEGAILLAKEQGPPIELAFAADTTAEYARRIANGELLEQALLELVGVAPDRHEAWEELVRLAELRTPGSGEAVYWTLLNQRPEDPQAHVLYSTWLLNQQRVEDADAHLRRVWDEGIDDPIVGEARVRLALRRGRVGDAHAIYMEMAEEHPTAFPTRVAEGRVALATEHYDAAAVALRLALEEDESFELQRLLALAELRRDRLEAARVAIERAAELAPPGNVAVLRLRARIDTRSERWRRAAEAYQALLEQGQRLRVWERVDLAESLYRSGQRDLALTTLAPLVAPPKPSPSASALYARLEGERAPAEVRRALELAHERVPGHPEVLKALTRLDLEAGAAQAALDRLNRVVESGDATPAALMLRAEVLVTGGEYAYAEADVLRAFEADPALPGAIELLHDLYRVQGKLEEVRRSFEQADQAGVLHPGARLLLARLYLDEGDAARARTAIEKVVEERPDLWTAKADLAYVLALRGEELERAEAMAHEAFDASHRAPRAVDTMGWVKLKSGRPRLALQDFQRATRLAQEQGEPPSPTIAYHRGLALRALGREGEAAEAFQAALAHGDFPEAEDARQQLEAARDSGAPAGSST